MYVKYVLPTLHKYSFTMFFFIIHKQTKIDHERTDFSPKVDTYQSPNCTGEGQQLG